VAVCRADGVDIETEMVRAGMAFPVADALVALGVPFVIVTGQSPAVLPDHLRDRPTILKPYSKTELMSALKKLTSVPEAQ
jgi:endonuclease YncB( thermonuclease family)